MEPVGSLLGLGEVTKTHGIKGQLFVSLFVPPLDLEVPPIINQIVYFKKKSQWILKSVVEKASLHKKGMLISVENIKELSSAENLKGSHIFAQKKLFSSKKGESIYLCEIAGFQVYDKTRGNLGIIKSFLDNGAQDLLMVETVSKIQIEIPFIKPLVVKTNFKLKQIIVDLPLGWPGLE